MSLKVKKIRRIELETLEVDIDSEESDTVVKVNV